MKTIIAVSVLSLTLAGAALGQPQVFTPAPVPNRGAADEPPADRVSRPDGSERQAPFSGIPTGIEAGGGEAGPSTIETPGRTTAPSPSLAR